LERRADRIGCGAEIRLRFSLIRSGGRPIE
jgi:hypothetical protein